MTVHDSILVDHATRLKTLSLAEQTALDSIAIRAQNIARKEEELSAGRALMDIKKLLTIIGGEYARRASEIQGY